MEADDQLRAAASREEMLREIITRNTNAIMADTAAKVRLADAIDSFERRVSVTPLPQTLTVKPRWSRVTLLAAGVGSVVACVWLTAGQALAWLGSVFQ